MRHPSFVPARHSSEENCLRSGPPARRMLIPYFPGLDVLPALPASSLVRLACVATALVVCLVARADTVPQAPSLLHLDQAVDTALKQSPTLLSAQANVGSAEGAAEQTRASLLPQLNASAVGERLYGSTGVQSGSGSVGVAGSKVRNNFTFSLNGTQLIWDFQSVDRTRSSYANVSALQATEQATVLNTILNVRTAFFLAQADRALIQVQQETLENQIKHQTQTEAFVKVGTQPEIALAQARTNVANAKVALIQAQNNYIIAKAQLNQAMGVVQGTGYEVANEELPPLPGEDQSVDALMEIALRERPEIAANMKNVEAQDLALRAARGGYLPAFSLFGSLAETGPALNQLGPAWDFGLQATWDFFDGLKTPGVVKQAQNNLDNANAQLTAEELQVRFDVEQADATLLGSKEALVAADDALVNAREQLRLAEQRYATGVGSIIELSDAQVAATSAGAQLVQARFTLATARAQLLAALGR